MAGHFFGEGDVQKKVLCWRKKKGEGPTFCVGWGHVTFHVSHITCHISCVMCLFSSVTCHLSLIPKATAADPPLANSHSIHSRLVQSRLKLNSSKLILIVPKKLSLTQTNETWRNLKMKIKGQKFSSNLIWILSMALMIMLPKKQWF